MTEQQIEEQVALPQEEARETADTALPTAPVQEAELSEESEEEPEEKIAGCKHCMVRLRYAGRCAEYCADKIDVRCGGDVVVDCERGLTLGKVLTAKPCDGCQGDCQLPKIDHQATAQDMEQFHTNQEKEKEAFEFCQQRILERNLPMKLLGVEMMLNGSKSIFYFFSEGRVDFRALVKDLAQRFHTRIEMRQIGVRDGAKILGGLGICGRELCCAGWLTTFEPVSIRMAKDQNLSLNPQKVSGLCGRLMCCLVYEQATYTLLRKGLPKIGKRVVTPDGEGRVREVNVILRQVKVDLENQTLLYCLDEEGNYRQVEATTENNRVQPLDSRANRQEALNGPITPVPMDDDNSFSDGNGTALLEEVSGQSPDISPATSAEPAPEAETPAAPALEKNSQNSGNNRDYHNNRDNRDNRDNHNNRDNNRNRGDRDSHTNRHNRPPRENERRPNNHRPESEEETSHQHPLNRNYRHHHRPNTNNRGQGPKNEEQ